MEQQALMERRWLRYSYWTLVGILVALGLSFIVVRLVTGPSDANLGSVIPWGLGLSLYILFVGLSAGSFLVSSLIYAFNVRKYERIGRLAVFSAVICLIIALLMVLFDLGHPERFWRIWSTVANRSVLWWMIQVMMIYILLLLVEAYLLMRSDLIRLRESSTGIKRGLYRVLALGSQRVDPASRERDMRWVRILAIIGIPTAIAVHGGTGSVFGVMKSVAYYHHPLTPIMFITSALVSGAGLLLFVRAFFFKSDGEKNGLLSSLGKLVLLLIAIDWVLIIAEYLVGVYGGMSGHVDVIETQIFGSRWWIFWLFQVGLGIVAPVFIILSKWTRKSRGWLGLAGLAAVLGVIGWRWNFIVVPLSIPAIEGMTEAFYSARISSSYAPSLGEWLTYTGLFALWFLFLSLGKALLPLEAADNESDTREEG